MRIRQIEYFVRICELGSITRAAQAMNIAQPALGLQISSLERELGVRLLVRSKRGITTTPAGAILLQESRDLLRRITDLKQQLLSLSKESHRTFTFGLPPSLISILTSKLLTLLRTKTTFVNVKIFEEMSHVLVDRIEACELDVALAFDIPADSKVHRKAYSSEELCFIAARGSSADKREPIPSGELSRWKFVMSSERASIRKLMDGATKPFSGPLDIIYNVESVQGIKELVAKNFACGILPYSLVEQDVKNGTLIARNIVDPVVTRTLFVTWSSVFERSAESEVLLTAIDKLLPTIHGKIGKKAP